MDGGRSTDKSRTCMQDKKGLFTHYVIRKNVCVSEVIISKYPLAK